MKKVLITGAGGQLAGELFNTFNNKKYMVVLASRTDLDISERDKVHEFVSEFKPNIIINCAAYTNVDKAESDIDLAFEVNCIGVRNLAEVARATNAKLVHISTDFVFDGNASSPYTTNDLTNPINVYGKSKLAGEKVIQATLSKYLILGTAWLYRINGNNFVNTMLKLMNDKNEIRVVSDQIGSPTCARSLAKVIWSALDKDLLGLYHFTDSGTVSWYGFACEIKRIALNLGILKTKIDIIPVTSAEYKTVASRPKYSVLDNDELLQKLKFEHKNWQNQLEIMLKEISVGKINFKL